MRRLDLPRPQLRRSTLRAKRAFDLAAASVALIVLAPLLLVVAIAVRLESRGPILFRQARIGRFGKPFRVFKFRSMQNGADAQRPELIQLHRTNGTFKLVADPRVTRVGFWIRRRYLDELPQLVNVLRGEMSLVGPRPLPADEDALVEGAYRARLQVPPGLTGPWQVRGSWRVPVEEMMALDYAYVQAVSLRGDLKLLAQTVPAVLRGRGV